MLNVDQMLIDGYRFGAPSEEAEQIDVEVAREMTCPKCQGAMRYEGYHRPGEYIALAVCRHCGHEISF